MLVDPDLPDISNIPLCHRDLKEFFSKATLLPPHHPYDCTINLLPRASPPKGRVLFRLQEGQVTVALNQLPGTKYCDHEEQLPSPSHILTCRIPSFTKLDLRNAYHLVKIREWDDWKTAVNTQDGHSEYLIMPFSLTNSPAMFEALVNGLFLFGQHPDFFLWYLPLLQHLLRNGLYVKAEKCDFHSSSVSFLGFIVGEETISMDSEKVQAVRAWTTQDQLQRFLGFANFYSLFI